MTDTFEPKLAGLQPGQWYDTLEELAEEHGYFEPVGQNHCACFIDLGPRLLVTFERADRVRQMSDRQEPVAFGFARDDGWSVLTILAEGETWFRDPALYGYIDRLIDDGFFEDFDDVLFYGADDGGYAATAYSVAAPGARVLAIQPRASLDPEIAGWDPRHRAQRRLTFTDRFGYAPDMIEATQSTAIVFDPRQAHDAMHAALFRRANTRLLRCAGLGPSVERDLMRMGALGGLIRRAMEADLDRAAFGRAYRARRSYLPYLRSLVNDLERGNQPGRVAAVCRTILRRQNRPFFAKRLEAAIANGAPDIAFDTAEG